MRARSSRKSKTKKIVIPIIIFGVVICIGLLLPKLFNFIGGLVMTPIHGVSQWYQTSDEMLPVLLRDKSSLNQEIKDLKNQLLAAQGQDLTLRRLQDENNRFRSLLGAADVDRVAANVIARPDELPYDLLQIDQGSLAGIREESLVYLGADQVIGFVAQVAPSYSFVQLFTTPGAEMTGFISGPDVIATVEGVGGGVARIRVPQGIPLSIGDLVYVPSIDPGVFGRIDYIENRPSQPEQFGYITLQTSIQSLNKVAVANAVLETTSVEEILLGKESIITERLLLEELNTVSFEELLATSTPTSTAETNENQNDE